MGILCILRNAETKKKFVVLTIQPRIPAGEINFVEIPAGMVFYNFFLN